MYHSQSIYKTIKFLDYLFDDKRNSADDLYRFSKYAVVETAGYIEEEIKRIFVECSDRIPCDNTSPSKSFEIGGKINCCELHCKLYKILDKTHGCIYVPTISTLLLGHLTSAENRMIMKECKSADKDYEQMSHNLANKRNDYAHTHSILLNHGPSRPKDFKEYIDIALFFIKKVDKKLREKYPQPNQL